MTDGLSAVLDLVLVLQLLGISTVVLDLCDQTVAHALGLLLALLLLLLQELDTVLDELATLVDVTPVEVLVHVLVVLGVGSLDLGVDLLTLLLGGVDLQEIRVFLPLSVLSTLFLLVILALLSLLVDALDDLVDLVTLLVERTQLVDDRFTELLHLVALHLDLQVLLGLGKGALESAQLLDQSALFGSGERLVVEGVLDVLHFLFDRAGLALASGDVANELGDLSVELLQLLVVWLLLLRNLLDLLVQSFLLLEVHVVAEVDLLVLGLALLTLLDQTVEVDLAVFEELVDLA